MVPLRFLDVSGKAFRKFHVAMADNLYTKSALTNF